MSLLRRSGAGAGARPRPAEVVAAVVVAADDGGGVDERDVERYRALAAAVLAQEGVCGPAELTLTFVDEATIAGLNEEWMGEAGATDVLSWPIDARDPPDPVGPPVLLGDVVVCPAVAARHAAADGRSQADELALLVVHGVLHVLGWDHAEPADATAMRQREHDHLTLLYDHRWTHSSS